MTSILHLVPQYGYILIYILLTIELMGIPFLPGEILIIYSGFLVYKGELNFILVLISAVLGVCSGMTASYFIGKKLGAPFFKKHGSKIHLGPEKMDKISKILDKFGMVLIFFICFIPGLKHIIGYFSGMSEFKYKKYAISAYTGAIVWAGIFLTIGDVLGENWKMFHKYLHKYLISGAILAILVIGIFFIIKIYKENILNFIIKIVMKLYHTFNSLGKVRFFVLAVAVVFGAFIDIFANIISGIVSNQFTVFNDITYYITSRLFSNSYLFNLLFKLIAILTTNMMYVIVPVLLIIYMLNKKKNKNIEIKYIILTICGGFLLKELVMYLFNYISGYIMILQNFLDGRCFTVIVIYGFGLYIIYSHLENIYLRKVLIGVVIVLGLLTGIAQLYFENDLSSVLSGYTLGIVWVSLNIILLEIKKVTIRK